MKIRSLFISLLLLLTIVNTVSAVTIDETLYMYADGFTLQTYGEETYTYIESDGLTYWNLTEGGNITFINNYNSSHNLIETHGLYGIGNYNTIIRGDVYAPSGWTVDKLFIRLTSPLTNKNISTTFGDGYTIIQNTPDSNHKRYTYVFNPDDNFRNIKMEFYDEFDLTTSNIYGTNWMAQSFTVGAMGENTTFTVSSAKLLLSRFGSPDDISISIKELNGAGEPTGINLTYGTTNGNTLPSGFAAREWREIIFNNSINLSAGRNYSIVIAALSGTAANKAMWYQDTTGEYIGGIALSSTDYGATWTHNTAKDFCFEIYGEPLLETFNVNIFAVAHNNTLHYYGILDEPDSFSVYTLDQPWNPQSHYYSSSNRINLTWNTGNNSDTTLIRRINNTANVNSPTDGYTVYNGTLTYYNFTIAPGDTMSFSAFSYNTTTRSYSEPLHLNWGALQINVFNASKTWQPVDPFDLLIQNQAGDQTYAANGCTPPLYLDYNNLPVGINTIFKISATRYQTQTYTRSTVANSFYNYTFLLPPVSAGTPSIGNDSYVYQITIINQYNNPVQDALVTINEYVNGTDTYEQVYSFMTDGAGQVNPWLVPNTLYQIIINKAGYTDSTNYWTTTSSVFTKTFMIYYINPENTTSYIFGDKIHTSGYLDNATSNIYIDYLDDLGQTTNCQVYIYEINTSNSTNTLIYTYLSTGLNTFQINKIVQNKTNDFQIVFYINHTYFGAHSWSFIVEGYHLGHGITITTMNRFNILFMINFGWCPVGWSNLITWFIMLGCFFSFSRRDTWMIMFIIGFLLLFINYYIGFNTDIALFAGGAIPIVIILFGILMLIRDRKRFGVDF